MLNEPEGRNPARQEIERRAYELYEQRGREDGHDWDDWLQAEREVRGAASATVGSAEAAPTPRRRVAQPRGVESPIEVAQQV